jgi:Kef-type K+ transport system membrane component KefB
LVGLICPHDGGFAIKMTEKIEDLISVLFLPLYFALSGLSTNLGALNDGITWGYTVGVVIIAFAGKITGGTLAAKANKLLWRESFTIGCLMSCKGLVELIVLVRVPYDPELLFVRLLTLFCRTLAIKLVFWMSVRLPCSSSWPWSLPLPPHP